MPYITVTASPSPQAVAKDPVTRLRFTLNHPVEVGANANEIVGRLDSLKGLGFEFLVSDLPPDAPQESAAPSGAPDPTAEQAADIPAPPAPTP